MSIGIPYLAKPEEKETDIEKEFAHELECKWISTSFTGSDIALLLKMGKKGTKFAKFNPKHIYYYRQKYGLPLRREPYFARDTPYAKEHEVRAKRYNHKPKKIGLMDAETFYDLLDEKAPLGISEYFDRVRFFCLVLYLTPLRSSEIRERKRSDFEILPEEIVIHLLRKKKKHKADDEDEPCSIPRIFKYADELVDYLSKFTKDEYPFGFSTWTANRYTKELDERLYPHFFRHRWITEEANLPDTTIPKLTAKTRLNPMTLFNNYIYTPEHVEKEVDRAKIERYRKQGIIK